MTPRVASEIGVFSTKRVRQMASACSRLESDQYCSGDGIRRSKEFCFQIMIGQEFVDAPQSKLAECRGILMRVNIDELCGREYVLDSQRNLLFRERTAICRDESAAS